jgi:uracil phosphoribosyltransferase
MFRNETDLTPVEYYEHLPDNIAQGVAILVDPMLATGGSAVAGVKLLRSRGCADIRMVCLVAAPEGVRKLHDAYPDVPIIAAALDRQLNNVGYILPGLGDAGDRQFGTMPGA